MTTSLPLAFGLFLEKATSNPVGFVSVVVTVIVSVTLHELGHAYAAISQGDDTPRQAGRLTLNPVAHMGILSVVMLLAVGIAWGSTPVNPARFRSRHGDAWVSFAGPLVNLGLAFLGLTVLALWLRWGGDGSSPAKANFVEFLWRFGQVNVVLLLFNLLPLPPLDGSTIVASFVPPYRRIIRDPNNQAAMFAVFIALFFLTGRLFDVADQAALTYVNILRG